jgi:hypothetical protein
VYLEDGGIAKLTIPSAEGLTAGVKPYLLDESSSKNLWRLSEEITNINFVAN